MIQQKSCFQCGAKQNVCTMLDYYLEKWGQVYFCHIFCKLAFEDENDEKLKR